MNTTALSAAMPADNYHYATHRKVRWLVLMALSTRTGYIVQRQTVLQLVHHAITSNYSKTLSKHINLVSVETKSMTC